MDWSGLLGHERRASLVIARSSFHDNRAGIVRNRASEEADPPRRGLAIVGNTVGSNSDARTSAIDIATTLLVSTID